MTATAFHTVTHQLGSLLMNASDDNGSKWLVSVVDGGTSSPPPKLRTTNRPYGHGGYRARSFWGPRLFALQGVVVCPNGLIAEMVADTLRGLFLFGNEITYTRSSRQGARTLQVELADTLRVDTLVGGNAVRFQIPLRANDPRYLGPVGTTPPAAVASPSNSGLDWATGGGLDWATGGGLNWGSPSGTGLISLVNAGTADAYPLITIAGPIINPSITDSATGRIVAYAGSIDVGQTLVIDMSPFTRSVLLNGIDRAAALSSAQWITVPPLTTRTLQFGGSGLGTAAASMQSAYV